MVALRTTRAALAAPRTAERETGGASAATRKDLRQGVTRMRRTLVVLLILAAATAVTGFARGWFSIRTSQAASKSEVTFGVDSDKVRGDAAATAEQLGELSAAAAESVRNLAHRIDPQQSELAGKLTSVDAGAHRIVLEAGSKAIELHVGDDVPILKGGKGVGFGDLQPGMQLNVRFQHAGDNRRLARIEILG
jgi:hypothetical protein